MINLFKTFKNGLAAKGLAYAKNTAGQFAIMFAVASTALMTGVAVSVDGSSMMSQKSELQDVADAISLFAVKKGLTDQTELNNLANDYLQGHYTNDALRTIELNTITRSGDDVTVDLSRNVKTAFYQVISNRKLAVNVNSTSTLTLRNLDISLVLDNTGSMRGRKLSALKGASNDLVDILYATDQGKKGTQIGLVPFASWVNVGKENINAKWIDQTGRSKQNQTYFERPVSRVALYRDMNAKWDGCVENRLPPYDVDDTPADPRRPETLFQPAFHPDMADNDGRGYSYVLDTVGGNPLARLKDVDKYTVKLPNSVDGPARRADDSCDPRRKVVPLTHNERDIRKGINNMYAAGWTNIANGASWGFRLVSPNAPFTQGRPYADERTDKAMVILTDGMQTMGGQSGSTFRSGYSPFGFLGEPAIDGKARMTGGNVKQALDNKLLEVCEAAKAKDIIVYTITFELNDRDTQDMMRACATDTGKYFDVVSASQLSPVFKEIAASLSELRVSR